MKITFKYNGVTYEHVVRNGTIKIYSVPLEYSEDGLYISDYSKKTTEPAPASISLSTELLFHAECKRVMGEEFMAELKNDLGEVTYAKD